MHYFKRNIGDYHKKAGRLSMLEHGAYTLLIDSCYDRERFPTRDDAIEWTWARTDAEIAAVDFVLSKFFDLEDGKYVQNRIREEIEKYHANSETNKRIAQEREDRRRTNRTRTVNEPPPNQEPITTNQEPLTKNHVKKRTSEYSDDFLMFWERYPKKTGKGDAWTLWKKLEPDITLVLDALSWQTKSNQWKSGYIPNPKTYLNGRRWEDSPVMEVMQNQTKHDSYMDTINQIFPDRKNGTDRQIIDINPRTTTESDGASLSKAFLGIRDSDG